MTARLTGPELPKSHAAPFRNSRLASSLYTGLTAHALFRSASSLSRKHTAGGDSTELRYPAETKPAMAATCDAAPFKNVNDCSDIDVRFTSSSVAGGSPDRPFKAQGSKASNAASHMHHVPLHTATQLSPMPYSSPYRTLGGGGIRLAMYLRCTSDAAYLCSFARPAVPATRHAAPDLRVSSGKTVVSMTYQAPRQKLATPMATAIWSGSLLHGWSSTARSSTTPAISW